MIFVSSAGSDQSVPGLLTNLAVPVQNYITAILVFLVVEMLMTWGFYGEIFPMTL
jgi:hypothetical protein